MKKRAPWEPNWNMADALPKTQCRVPAKVFQKRSLNWFVSIPALVTPKGPFATKEEAIAFAINRGYQVEE